MTRSLPGKLLILGVLATFAIPLVGMAQTYPEELSFLETQKPPRYLYVEGEVEIVDTAGVPMTGFPFIFYWEDGNYAFDIRNFGGIVMVYAKGIEDTVWVYDYPHDMKLVALRDQNFGVTAGLPFSPKDILMMFNIFPDGFAGEISTTTTDEENIYVTALDGSTFVFNKENEAMDRIEKRGYQITFSDYLRKKKTVIPTRVSLNRGFFVTGSAGVNVIMKEVSFKRVKKNNPLDATVPGSMGRNFDSRPESN